MSKELEPKLTTTPKIKIPPYVPPTPEQVEKRRRAIDEILRLRHEIGPIGISVTEWIREDRGWPDAAKEENG